MLKAAPQLCVLHVAALGDEEALQTLRRTSQAMAGEGIAQVLIALDDGRAGEPAWPGALAADVTPLRCARLSLVGKVRALQLELAKLSCERPPYAVHLHGLAACLLGWQALKGSPLEGRVLYSPHCSPFRLSWAMPVLGRLFQARLTPAQYAALADSPTEAHALSRLLNRSVEVLPHAVSDVFFACPRKQEPRVAVVADGSGGEAVDLVSRLCVLFNSREARVPFWWLGPADAETARQLVAGDVQILEAADEAERAQALSRASLFLHLSFREQAPHAVAQAMAAGVPCLASDTLAHRAIVRHGDTGYICTSERDFVEKITILLRDPAERARLGEAAREEAERRFTVRHFKAALLRAYGLPLRKAMRAAGMESTETAASASAPRAAAVQ